MSANRAAMLEVICAAGEMGARIRGFDWSGTPLGPIEAWPQSLVTVVRMMLCSRFPMFLWWGKDLTNFYNDAYIPVLGGKHPDALGRPAQAVWHEIWNTLGPQTRKVMDSEEATWNDRVLLEMERSGYKEETYFTWSYSPAFDDEGRVSGVFCACSEETGRVLSERRLRVLRRLSAETMAAESVEQVCANAAQVFSESAHDVPFALLYLLSPDGARVSLAGRAWLAEDSADAPETMPAESLTPWPSVKALAGEAATLTNLEPRALPGGPWPEPVATARVLPFRNGQDRPAGFIVLGVSPRRAFDEDYLSFFHLVAEGLSSAAARAYGQEQERRRLEALAEIDRTKTAFFSNVSHEFRTPLTLMLGPLENLLASEGAIAPKDREQVETAHRNSLRLLKLVNSLLDFSRLEAGRLKASFAPTDVATLTADLASQFRSAMQAAGIELVVDCKPLPEPVYVDRDMWEKVVLNLLSNAWKFTFNGRVTVTMQAGGDAAVLTVADTGTGIPESEMPRLFERFHRVEGAKGRTYEGTGIGLALVKELVKLHGGDIEVTSRLNAGSTFTVRLPFGTAHIAEERLAAAAGAASTTIRSDAFTGEAMAWLGPELATVSANLPSAQKRAPRARILVADDNADMREHLYRLLGGDYDIEAVSNGAAALGAVRARQPDLIVSDVMMPVLDGFRLLRELRADENLREIPVILVSARAGEEARTEGIGAGADDYLTKPFSAKELAARIETTLRLQRLRREARADVERANESLRQRTAQFETLLNQAPMGVYVVDADFRIVQVNPTALLTFGDIPDLIGRDFEEVMYVLWTREYADEIVRRFRNTLETGEPWVTPEQTEYRIDRQTKEHYEWRIDRIPLPGGRFGVVCYFRDISHQVMAREALRANDERLAMAMEVAGMGTWDVDLRTGRAHWSRRHFEMLGYAEPGQEASLEMWRSRVHPDDLEGVDRAVEEARIVQDRYVSEHRIIRADSGEVRWLSEFGRYIYDSGRQAQRFVGISFDITHRKEAEAQRARSQKTLFELVERAPFGIYIVDSRFRIAMVNAGSQNHAFRNVRPVIGRDFSEAMHILWHPSIAEEIIAAFRHTLESGEPYYSPRFVNSRQDLGTTEAYEWQLHRMVLPEGQYGVVCYYFDSTELRNTEAALRRANLDLEQFAWSASHDLQEPIRTVRIYSELLADRYRDSFEGEGLEFLNFLSAGASRMEMLVRDLLAYTHATRLERPEAPEDSGAALNNALANLSGSIEASGARVTAGPMPAVRVHSMQLQQIFQNLIGNAVKYRRPDAPPVVHVAAERENEKWHFSVSDNGIGIDPEFKERVFELFKRLHTRDEYSGSGIGLALCQRIVEKYRGRIWVESEPGEGSTFHFLLPA